MSLPALIAAHPQLSLAIAQIGGSLLSGLAGRGREKKYQKQLEKERRFGNLISALTRGQMSYNSNAAPPAPGFVEQFAGGVSQAAGIANTIYGATQADKMRKLQEQALIQGLQKGERELMTQAGSALGQAQPEALSMRTPELTQKLRSNLPPEVVSGFDQGLILNLQQQQLQQGLMQKTGTDLYNQVGPEFLSMKTPELTQRLSRELPEGLATGYRVEGRRQALEDIGAEGDYYAKMGTYQGARARTGAPNAQLINLAEEIGKSIAVQTYTGGILPPEKRREMYLQASPDMARNELTAADAAYFQEYSRKTKPGTSERILFNQFLYEGPARALSADAYVSKSKDIMTGFATLLSSYKINDSIGDVGMVQGIARMRDPNSVVRGEEIRNIDEAVAWLDKQMNLPAKFTAGRRFTDNFRQRLYKAGIDLYETNQKIVSQMVEKEVRQIKLGWGSQFPDLIDAFEAKYQLPDWRSFTTTSERTQEAIPDSSLTNLMLQLRQSLRQ